MSINHGKFVDVGSVVEVFLPGAKRGTPVSEDIMSQRVDGSVGKCMSVSVCRIVQRFNKIVWAELTCVRNVGKDGILRRFLT